MANLSELGTTSLHTIADFHNIDPKYRLYLQHNDLPDDHILAELVKIKQEPLKELRSIEKDVRALYFVFQSLKSRENTLKDLLSTYNSILAPIRRLPDDILGEIFFHCLPTTRNARPFVSESPLLLTLVCKKWRRVALTAPRLWSSLHIPVVFNFPSATTHPFSGPLDRQDGATSISAPPARLFEVQKARNLGLDGWLCRSGTLPLSISLHSQEMSRPSPPRLQISGEENTIKLVAKFADRISSLEAITPHCILVKLGEAIARLFHFKKLPRLTRLRLMYNTQMSVSLGGQSVSEVPMFFSADTLRELCLRAQWISSDMEKYILSNVSSSITVLSMHSPIRLPLALRLLAKLPQLERCHLGIVSDDNLPHAALPEAFNTSFAPINLASLTTISIHGVLPVINTLCQLLVTPSLLNLQLFVERTELPMGPIAQAGNPSLGTDNRDADIDLPYPPPTTEHLTTFLSKCSSLQRLTINPSYVQAAELQSIFSSVPQLKRLIITNGITVPRSGNAEMPTFRSSLKYSFHPLFKQERVCISTGESITLDEPLLPCLVSFTWCQFSAHIPNDLSVAFVKSRLHPTHINTANAADGVPKVAPLQHVGLYIAHVGDARKIQAELVHHVESAGMRKERPKFFASVSIPTGYQMSQSPQYVIPKGYTRPTPVFVTADNLNLERNTTWPFIDI